MLKRLKSLFPQSIKNLYHLGVAMYAVGRYGYPARKLKVIGVTGTDGKTTTSTMIYHVLQASDKKVALVSTVAAFIGEAEISTGFHVTSPDPVPLQKLISEVVKEGFEYLVLEATSHGLDQHRLFGTNIKYAVITNITHEHLDYHGTYDHYLEAKAKILQNADLVVLNQDDNSYQKLLTLKPSQTKLVGFTLKAQSSMHQFVTKNFVEDFNQSNAMAAVSLCSELGVTNSQLKSGLKSYQGVIGRMDQIKNKLGLRLIVDFAHTPNALSSALTSLKSTTSGKLIAVFGAAGKRDYDKRPLMGDIVAKLADEVVLTAEDPRTEDVRDIIFQLKSGITTNHGHVHAIIDRSDAITFAIKVLAKPGDTVGIFGKGHEQTMNLDGITEIPWSDHQVVSQVLKKESS